MNYFLAVGCSHTAGVGIQSDEIYVQCLSRDIGLDCINLSYNGCDSEYTLQQIVKTLRKDQLPNFIIAQWPNIFRKTFYNDKEFYFENVNSSGEIFNKLLKLSENNFVKPWIQHMVTADTLADSIGIPIYHIYLDYTDVKIENNIKLHQDFKRPGETWLFDNGASDGLHHSAKCHRAWADRLNRIINEDTA